MRLLPFLLLFAGLASGCRASDGWPHDADAPWRVAIAEKDAATWVLFDRKDEIPASVDVVGYRSTTRSTLAEAPLAWNPCPGARDFARVRAYAALTPPEHPGIAIVGLAEPPALQRPSLTPADLSTHARERLVELALADARAARGRAGSEAPEVTLRTLVKVRRPGSPPQYLAAGEAGCRGYVALLDTTARLSVVSDVVDLPGPTCAPMAAQPPTDLDGDGRLEVVARAGNGEPGTGVLRAVWRLDPEEPRLERVWKHALACTATRR
ncbi:MAG: hypothetical protein JXB39_11380 [Deltaproteobacteria bacterium]|nr:hypothetical protein [Deltaproteobacteria bacterium]